MALTCPVAICGRQMPGTATICGACEAELKRALTDATWLAVELRTTIAKQAVLSTQSSGGKPIAPPLPYSPHASEIGKILHRILVGWTHVMQEHVRRAPGPICRRRTTGGICGHPSCMAIDGPADDTRELALWLRGRASSLTRHEAAVEVHDEIVEAVNAAARVIDRRAERVYAGPCGECGTDLYAKPGAVAATCRTCGEGHHIATQHERMLEQLGDRLEHAAGAGKILRVTGVDVADSTIRYLAQQGRILSHGLDVHRRPLYRIGEILEVLAARTTRAAC